MKTKLLTALSVPLLLLGALTGCSSTGEENKISPSELKEIILNNINKDEVKDKGLKYDERKVFIKDEKIDSINEAILAETGVILYQDSAFKVAKNIITGKEIYKVAKDEVNFFNKLIKTNKHTAILNFLDHGGKNIYFDNYGNKIELKDEKGNALDIASARISSIKDVKILFVTDVNDNVHYYKYSDLVAEQITRKDFEALDNRIVPDYEAGDKFVMNGLVDLSMLGLKDYSAVINKGLVTTFHKGKETATFAIPRNVEPFVIGKNIYYQEVSPLPDDNSKYDFIKEGKKYFLDTVQIDFATGMKTDIKFNGVVNYTAPLIDNEGFFKLSSINFKEIKRNKILMDYNVEHIYDQDLHFVGNVTDMDISSFTTFGKGFYHKENKAIYDSNLNVITYLGEVYVCEVASKSGLIVARLNYDDNKYGIINDDGTIVAPFEYDKILVNDFSGHVIGVKDKTIYVIDVTTNKSTLLGEYEEIISDGPILIAKKDHKQEAISADGMLVKFDDENVVSFKSIGSMLFINDTLVKLMKVNYKNGQLKIIGLAN